MKQGGKGLRTPRQVESIAARRVRSSAMQEWFRDRVAAAQKRKAKGQRRRPSGHGVTLEMKAISREARQRPVERMYEFTGVNPERDLRKGRRLRAEGTWS